MGCRHNWTVSYSTGGKVCSKCSARISGVNAGKIKRKRDGRGGSRAVWIIIGLVLLGVGGGIRWAATEGIPMATDAVDDAAGTITETVNEMAPDAERVIADAVDMADVVADTITDTVTEVVDDPEAITGMVIDLLPDAVGPYVLQPGEEPPEPRASLDVPIQSKPSHDRADSPPDMPDPPGSSVFEQSRHVRGGAAFDADVERHILDITNKYRLLEGLDELGRMDIIDSVAKGHSQDMAERGYFDHIGPGGMDPTDRGMAAGYDCRKDYDSYYTYGLAENIYMIDWVGRKGAGDVAADTVTAWMQSPGHRANILEPSYDSIGVGIAINDQGEMYATQNFC